MIQKIESKIIAKQERPSDIIQMVSPAIFNAYTVPVIVRVLNPGLELHSPVVSLTVNVAAGTVTFRHR